MTPRLPPPDRLFLSERSRRRRYGREIKRDEPVLYLPLSPRPWWMPEDYVDVMLLLGAPLVAVLLFLVAVIWA